MADIKSFTVPEAMASALGFNRAALVGLDNANAAQFEEVLRSVGIAPHLFSDVSALLSSTKSFDFVICDASAIDKGGNSSLAGFKTYECKNLLARAQQLKGEAYDFLSPPWSREDVLLRLCRVLSMSQTTPVDPPLDKDERCSPRVVIADDDRTTSTMVATLLARYGMEFAIAADGVQALEMAKAFRPDIMLLDLLMPRLGGFEVLSSLKSHAETRHIRVVILSARNNGDEMVCGFALGADDYIMKPYSPIELVARVRRLVRKIA